MFATPDHALFLLARAHKFPKLKFIVVMEDVEDGERRALDTFAQEKGVKLMVMAEREASLHESVVDTHYMPTPCVVEAFGNANLVDPIRPDPDTIATICYTSVGLLPISCIGARFECLTCYQGTSGTPKGNATPFRSPYRLLIYLLGVMLSHANVAMSVYAFLHYSAFIHPERTAMSFLPLAHVYEVRADMM